MSQSNDEVERRRLIGLAAIASALDSTDSIDTPDDGDQAVKLFVTHHLRELPAEYWLDRCGVVRPDPRQVLELLVLESHWGEEDEEGLDNFDFSLPGNVTQYVLSVGFDDDGRVSSLSMES